MVPNQIESYMIPFRPLRNRSSCFYRFNTNAWLQTIPQTIPSAQPSPAKHAVPPTRSSHCIPSTTRTFRCDVVNTQQYKARLAQYAYSLSCNVEVTGDLLQQPQVKPQLRHQLQCPPWRWPRGPCRSLTAEMYWDRKLVRTRCTVLNYDQWIAYYHSKKPVVGSDTCLHLDSHSKQYENRNSRHNLDAGKLENEKAVSDKPPLHSCCAPPARSVSVNSLRMAESCPALLQN